MLFIIGGLFTAFVLVFLQSIYVRKIKYRALSKLPGPPSNYLWGKLFDSNRSLEDSFESTVQLNKIYGPVVALWTHPWRPLVVVSHAKFIEKILSTNTHLSKSSLYEHLKPFLGESLPVTNVETWKRQRKILNPAFQPKIFETFVPILEHHGNKLIDILKKQTYNEIDLPPLVDPYVLDAICEFMLKVRTNFQESSDNGYFKARSAYLTIFMNRAFSLLKKANIPFTYGNERQISEQCLKILHTFTKDMITKAMEIRRKLNGLDDKMEFNKTVIDCLLNGGMPEKEIRDNITLFLVAGHDTPGSTIAFALYELAKHAKIQAQVLKEIVSIVGTDRNSEISIQNLQSMTYLECVIKETLRHHSAIPIHERLLDEDITIDGITIPKGTEVTIAVYAVHHDEKYYPNPNIFNPDRFLPDNLHKIQPFTFIPFSKGPRDCIGKTLAMIWMKHVIAKIIQNFELFPVEPRHTVKLTCEFVLKSANGLPVRIKNREW